MSRSLYLWIIAFILTVASAGYQRITGPTYPISGTFQIDGQTYRYKFDRSHGGTDDALIGVKVPGHVTGEVQWRRFNAGEDWTHTPLRVSHDSLVATLPHQPIAGKLEYQMVLTDGKNEFRLPSDQTVVMRFKGDVPVWVLVPHILAMFLGMFFSMRVGLELFARHPDAAVQLRYLKFISLWTLALLIVGGFILGAVVQKYAFDAYWTGWPLGTDLTDNKTALAIAAWIVALLMYSRSRQPAWWGFVAALITMIVFLIPHSMFGSELKYEKPTTSMNMIHQRSITVFNNSMMGSLNRREGMGNGID